jgi:tRNA(fMet)-specific endonuclease VapC
MLDTNILSDVLKRADSGSARMLKQLGFARTCTSAIVASELRYGVQKKGSARLQQEVEFFLSRIKVLDYDDPASLSYAAIRDDLEKRGVIIGAVDLFIAAHVKSLGITLVTDNMREFSCVEGLKLENWIERQNP